ncbi:CU044_5270 family protein [Streptomyces sp. NBC_01304]|uniref:CU044_5270 family protein n=1 Tax=Streptomyces sp. NBC_01304 TaxID=2903818 RepID=UPI002E1371ED|nr:CU044_5270 family protein [Streptomyces sp. NBC_01304]
MDELTKVRELRADAPTPDRARLAAGRKRLTDATAKPSRARRMRLDWRLAAAGAAAAVTAAALLAVNLGDGAAPPAGKSDVAASETAGLGDTAEVLERAARSVQGFKEGVPRDDQWLYVEQVDAGSGGWPDDGVPVKPEKSESWYRWADPDFENGKEGDDRSMREQYKIITELPDDPQAILAAVRKAYPSDKRSHKSEAAHNFRALSVLIGSPVSGLDGAGLAKLYRALATLPGIEVTDHLVKDAAGRKVIAVGLNLGKQAVMRDEILLYPETYFYAGSRWVVAKDYSEKYPDSDLPDRPWKAGDIVSSSASTGVSVVDKKGDRS